MTPFDDVERSIDRPSRHSEPTFDYLNNSARAGFAQVRLFLEEWFAAYPDPNKPDLRSRFRSPIEAHHQAAFFELFLHRLFVRLQTAVEVHPEIPPHGRTPDLLVHPRGQSPFIVEATVVTFQSSEDAAGQARLQQVYDVLDRHVDPTNFFIWVEVDTSPNTPPPARQIAAFINSKLREVEPDILTELYERGGLKAAPAWPFSHGGWSILFRPIPKKPEARGRDGTRPLGMFSSGVKSVDHRTPLRDAAAEKAGSYDPGSLSFVVALNALENIDEIDIAEALLGKEKFTIRFPADQGPEAGYTEMSREPDGLWTSPAGPTRKAVSAVLIASRLRPWSIGDSQLILYHNPWATTPLAFALNAIAQQVPVQDHFVHVPGRDLPELVGTTWPLMAG